MKIQITNDGKERPQSFEATTGVYALFIMGQVDIKIIAYGEDKQEAINHLMSNVDYAINKLNLLKRSRKTYEDLGNAGVNPSQIEKILGVINGMPIHIHEGIENTRVRINDGVVIVEKNTPHKP